MHLPRTGAGCLIGNYLVVVCLRGRVDTIARRLVSCTMSLAGPGSILGAGAVNQAVPSGVGRLLAIIVGSWVTIVEYCEC